MGTIAARSASCIAIPDAIGGSAFVVVGTDSLAVEPADSGDADAALTARAVETVGLLADASPAEANRALVAITTRRAVACLVANVVIGVGVIASVFAYAAIGLVTSTGTGVGSIASVDFVTGIGALVERGV